MSFRELFFADDYHEFGSIVDGFISRKFNYKELGFYQNGYIGLIYEGEEPSQEDIDRLLSDNKIVLES